MDLDIKIIEDRLLNSVSLDQLLREHPRSFRAFIVSHLYELWRGRQLSVIRSWRGFLDPPEEVPYSKSSLLLPEDILEYRTLDRSKPLSVVTWNVNSIRARLPLILSFLKTRRPDILCLQETKVENHQFPEEEVGAMGYQTIYDGQKSYNGVAILSRFPVSKARIGFSSGYDSENKRLIQASIEGIHFINVYVPQGQTTESDKFRYKLSFLKTLFDEVIIPLNKADSIILLGDINIAPDHRDVSDPEAMRGMVSFHELEHDWLRKLSEWGFSDVYRKFHSDGNRFSWWDFRTRGFVKNEGLRIDHLWVSDILRKNAIQCEIDTDVRKMSKPSDHAPVTCLFERKFS